VVGVRAVAVVALLEPLIDVAVAASGDLAVRRALAGGAVFRAEITLLASVDGPVATVGARITVTIAGLAVAVATVHGGEGREPAVVARSARRARGDEEHEGREG